MIENETKKIEKDLSRAKSLKKMSENSLKFIKTLKINKKNYTAIFRELYEALRQNIESIGYSKGFKFRSHEAITKFLGEKLNEKIISSKFDRYRVLRNRMNYYGNPPMLETVKQATKEIPKMIKYLEKYQK